MWSSYRKYLSQSSGFWQLLSIVCISLSSFLAAVVLSHLFTPEEYGVYRYILAWTILSSFFTLSGANFAVTQATLDGAPGTLFSTIKARLILGVFGALFFAGLAGYYLFQGNTELALLFAIYAPFVAISEGLTSHLGYFLGKKELRTNFLFEVSTNVLVTLFVICGVFLYGSVLVALVVSFTVTFLLRLFGTLYVLRKIPRNARSENVLHYSAKLTLFNMFEVAAQFLDKVIVFHFLGAAGLAFYVFTVIFVDQIRELLRVIIWKNIILDKEAISIFGFANLRMVVSVCAVVLFVVYAALAPTLYEVFFPKYTSVVFASAIYALSFFTVYMYIPMYRYQQERRTRMYGVHQMVILISVGVFISLGAIYFGLIGAMAGALLSKVVAAFSSYMLYGRFVYTKQS
jgi:O-antigen/teichoic acid export membrane protein